MPLFVEMLGFQISVVFNYFLDLMATRNTHRSKKLTSAIDVHFFFNLIKLCFSNSKSMMRNFVEKFFKTSRIMEGKS